MIRWWFTTRRIFPFAIRGTHVNTDPATPFATEPKPGAALPASTGKPANRQRRHDDRPDVWRLAHRALRGRYQLAIALAIGGAIAGAGLGAAFGRRLYRATGIVRIAFAREAVMKETDQNRSLPMFDGYIQAQGELMTGRENVQAAMRDENWAKVTKQLHRRVSDEQFATSLKAETRHGSDHVHVSYTDADPRLATAAVRAVISTFQQSYDRDEARSERQRMDELKSRRDSLGAELKGVQQDLGPLGAAAGGPNVAVDPLYEAATGRLNRFRTALVDLQCVIAGGPVAPERAAQQPATPAEMAATSMLNAFVSQQTQHTMELNRLIQAGCGPQHPLVLRLQTALHDDADQVARCEKQVEDLRQSRAQVGPTKDLKAQEAALVRRVADAQADIKRLVEEHAHLVALSQRAAELQQKLDEVTTRIDVLTTEASLGSRLTVVDGGEKPMTASLDNRPKYAVLGAGLGATLPIGLLIMLAGVRRRYRNAVEVAEDLATRVPFVAVLPAADEASGAAQDAARAVHQLRVRLQPLPAAAPTGAGRAYLVTSPEVGDGKSGIALSLGLSFAAAGYRTLLIDGDLSTRRLTRGLGAEQAAGFREAADGREPLIRSLRAGLCFMPSGRCRPEDQYTLTAAHVLRVLERVRRQFEIILIDTDPLLTGVASAVAAGQVDGVLFNVTRDQSQSAVREAMRMLEQQRATVAGCIFNRDRTTTGEAQAPATQASTAAEAVAPSAKRKPRRRALDLPKDSDAVATTMSPVTLHAPAAPMRTPRRRALDLPRDPEASATTTPSTPAPSPIIEKPATVVAEPSPSLSDRLRAFGPLVAAVMSSLAVSEDETLALIDPPASAPRITIFPERTATAEPSMWQPRVA